MNILQERIQANKTAPHVTGCEDQQHPEERDRYHGNLTEGHAAAAKILHPETCALLSR